MDDYVVTVRKRKGRPNSGGGRSSQGRGRGHGNRGKHGKGRGGGGGGGGSKKGESDFFLDDFDLTSSKVYQPKKARGRGKPSQQTNRPPLRGVSRGGSDVRVPMQRLHMSNENQEMVRDMLKELHGELPAQSSKEDGEDCDSSEDGSEVEGDDVDVEYWVDRPNFIVEEDGETSATCNYSQEEFVEDRASTRHAVNSHSGLNRYAVNKLVRYGFDRERCESALSHTEGDIGAALEFLLSQCFNLKWNLSCPKANDVDWTDIYQQREDEMTALQSIYSNNFSERLANKVWFLKLESSVLDRLFPLQGMKGLQRSGLLKSDKSERKTCVFFQKGSCRYGGRCKFEHVTSDFDGPAVLPVTSDPSEPLYELEIRFPPGNQYPNEPPFLAFSTLNTSMSPQMCLIITHYLIEQAKSMADSGLPAIFSLVSTLEEESILKDLTNHPPMKFSLPEPILTRFAKKSVNPSMSFNSSSEFAPKFEDDVSVGLDSLDLGEEVNNEVEEDPVENVPVKKATRRDILPRKRKYEEILKDDKDLKIRFRRRQTFNSYKNMLAERRKLPAWNMKDEILNLVNKNQVVVVSGMTGCGKTTQVPQFILDQFLSGPNTQLCNIVCTQPRRISAVSVAGRVAEERTEKLGGIVGYQIRLESVQSSRTRLLFCTTGIILRRLEGDPTLSGVSHVIIDEVHERTEESDFLIMVLRDLLPSRPDLKVMLMSATVNAELFSTYFGECPVIEIPGKVFPVEQFFLEDAFEFTRVVIEDGSLYARPLSKMNAVRDPGVKGHGACVEDQIDVDLRSASNSDASVPASDKIRDENLNVKQLKYRYQGYGNLTLKSLAMMDHDKINYELIEALMEWFLQADHDFPRNGAILVFLPGFAEIQSLFDQLESSRVFGCRNRHSYKVIPLHSSLSSEEQNAVFSRPKEGVTKIVLATNIAETSITIDDVICVIDSGRMKEKRYDASKGMESLDTVWVSRANALQRKGRAGRVASGVCFHLFTSHRYDFHLRDQPIPEIQRAPLEQIVLKIRMLDLFKDENPETVLNKLLEPPTAESVTSAVKRLQDLGALNIERELTPLGYHLGSLPVDVRIGKLMLFGAIFRCLDPALTIAATLSFKSPFVSPFGKKEEATEKKVGFALGNSDHLTMLNGYKEWISVKKKRGGHAAFKFCIENFLSVKTLQMLASMKQQFVELLSDIGFVEEGLCVRDVERAARGGGDGVIEVTGMEANCNSNNLKLVAAILVGALYPNVVKVLSPEAKFSQGSAGAVPRLPKPEELRFKTKMDGYVHLHPSSVNFQVRYYDSPYLVYHEKVKTSRVYIRDSTMVSVYPLLLFGGGNISIDLKRGNFVLSVDDGWIKFLASSHQVAELVKELRLELDQLLEDKIQNPNMDLSTCPRGSKIISTIVKLISTQ